MATKSVFETAFGSSNLFLKKCKDCGEMTVNYAISEHDNEGQCWLSFRCYACGREWRGKAYRYNSLQMPGYKFQGFWNMFARPVAASWRGKRQAAIVLDKDWILLIKPGKEKRVPSSEVTLADGFYRLTMEDMPMNLIGMEDIYKSGFMMHFEKCKCGSVVFYSRIKNITLIKCTEEGQCRNCGKKYSSLRYSVDPTRLRYLFKLKSIKSGKVLYGISAGSNFEVFKEGRVISIPGSKVEILGNNSSESSL